MAGDWSEYSDCGLGLVKMGFGRALVRILGFYAGAGQKGRIRLGIDQNIRILGWSWPKRSDLAGHWSEKSGFGLGLVKVVGFDRALVRTFGFWAGAGQSDQIWLGIGQNIRILGWSWPLK